MIINPELLTSDDGEMAELLGKRSFTSRILNIIFDEAHCISTWSGFRTSYNRLGMLRYAAPDVPFYIVSATLPSPILTDIFETLHMQRHRVELIMHSNDRPDIFIAVKKMESAVNSYQDLSFLIKDGWKEGDDPPAKFLVFFDSIPDTEAAVAFLRKRLPASCANRIRFFHATTTTTFREEHLEEFRDLKTWGLCVTDAFGMVSTLLCITPLGTDLFCREWIFRMLKLWSSTAQRVISVRCGRDLAVVHAVREEGQLRSFWSRRKTHKAGERGRLPEHQRNRRESQ